MAKFKIMRSDNGKNSWKAVGTNPKTGRQMTIRGGQKGTKVGPKNQSAGKVKSYFARHGKATTPKKYINHKRWKGGAKAGSSVNIPNSLF